MPETWTYTARLRQGLCPQCSRQRDLPARIYCQRCLDKARARYVSRRYRLHERGMLYGPRPLCCGWWVTRALTLPWRCPTCSRTHTTRAHRQVGGQR